MAEADMDGSDLGEYDEEEQAFTAHARSKAREGPAHYDSEENEDGGASLNSKTKAPLPQVSGDHMDIEAYAGLYSGRTKIARLFFIAEKCVNNPAMELEALRLAYDEICNGENTTFYKEVCEKINGRLAPEYTLDKGWVETVDRRANLRFERLDNELNGYKTNLIKESIRMGYNDLGEFHYSRGELQQAFKSFVRTRDYCTTSKHIIQMCLSIILVSIELGQFVHVTNYVTKAEQTPDHNSDKLVSAKLTVATGLAHLENKKYKQAARKFCETPSELGTSYNEVIAPQDVATYGGLCALASFDRAQLKSQVIDNINFRSFLELVPEVRELIYDFYASRYASCLGYLGKLKTNLLLDIRLHNHVETLYENIRQRAMIQYANPFISLDLSTMAAAFNTDVPGVEKELAALIMEDRIQARIDSHNKILYARHADQRNATFQRVLQTSVDLERDVRAMLLRTNLMRQDFVTRGGSRKPFLRTP